MARETTNSDSRYIDMLVTPRAVGIPPGQNNYGFEWRDEAGAALDLARNRLLVAEGGINAIGIDPEIAAVTHIDTLEHIAHGRSGRQIAERSVRPAPAWPGGWTTRHRP